ncbi:protein of unknown function [Pustulibacterium marinum]|uniref:DUF4837 domain-containing protein n=2 Tax=Pustulibacterium marinum TaxID=1224947 RepID=A0A1I7ETJ8_9FLAO|nr:protein of unknown function [Pustulibacterium marinum]
MALFVLQACETTKEKDYRPPSIGTMNSISVVINNAMWNGKVGDKIRELFARPVDGLATEEPIFSLNQLPPSVFTGNTRIGRNVLIIQNSEENVARISEDLYATPQQVAVVKGSSEDEIIKLLDQNAEAMIKNFKEHELLEQQSRMRSSKIKEKELLDEFGITLKLPIVYRITTQKDKFFWIKRQIQKYEGGLLVYEVPYNSIPKDSTLSDALVKMKDSIGKANIPGRDPDRMWMVTEKAFAPSITHTTIDNRPAIESKGLWEMKNFLMGGPYVNYLIEDKPNNRYIVLEGFVFAPSIDKRDYMFELEAIAKSIKFKDDEDFDAEKYKE